ncbi:MAG: hypothetical protein K9I84_12130 [Leadbetterella sp.]|nr:hypothetical protein [Leadbetterella sp.]
MGKFYIYNARLEDNKYKEITLVFNPVSSFDFDALSKELHEFYKYFHQTSALLFIHCRKEIDVKEKINENMGKILKSIPKVEEGFLKKNIYFISYDQNGFIIGDNKKIWKENLKEILNQGLVNVFTKNGGLVESNGISHHFVFPSGKHSSKFLRAANVLVRKSEIDFIALNTLHLFKDIEYQNIYCDTLSISVIGYSMNSYLKKFGFNYEINVESFQSYNGLYDKNGIFYNDSIFLISASTSGGLINYLQENHPEIKSNEICTLFYLPLEKHSTVALERVVCKLERNTILNYGIEKYDTYKPPTKPCKYCDAHSTAISIQGDSFSLDEPVINVRNIIADKYISASLKGFVELFRFNNDLGTILKVSYGSSVLTRKNYNIYIDYEKIITNIQNYEKHKKKLDAYINQHVPAATKYIIHLNDEGSKKMANYIHAKLLKSEITIINHSELIEGRIPKDESAAILIVGSCITNGKNLLYLNRFFRDHEDIRLVYFIGINRISSISKSKELKSNIQYGLYGPVNASFVEIETIACDNSHTETPWEQELALLKKIQSELDKPAKFITERIQTIASFSSIKKKGGDNKIFFPSIKNVELEIRKNSAFFNDNKYYKNVTQSDVYFTIACVLNNMRNNHSDGLFQTSFIKNLLDPFVFDRFNDGIIQASILRSAKSEELNYSCSPKLSNDMLMLLSTFIQHVNEFQGEALLEFLYALSIRKLRLCKSDYLLLLDELKKFRKTEIIIFRREIKSVYKSSF